MSLRDKYDMVIESHAPSPSASARGSLPSEADQPVPTCGEMIVENISAVRPEAISYLVPARIPAGVLGLIAGEGGHGKSATTLHLAAAITSGTCAFGLAYPDPPHGKVLLVSCEDDWGSTIVPRLAAFGADMTRVLRVKGIKMKAGGLLEFHLGHFRELERLLRSDPEIRLVIIDPAGAFIGRAGVNENKDADLRTILGPLSDAANQTGATIILIKHLNKGTGLTAVQRVSGSVGYVNTCRFAYAIAPDPNDAERKLMVRIKANLLPAGTPGMAYRMVEVSPDEARALILARWPDLPTKDVEALSKQLFRQQWQHDVSADAETIMAGPSRSPRKSAEEAAAACAEFVRAFLGARSFPDAELEEAVKTKGFSMAALKAAKASLRKADRTDPTRLSSKPKGEGGPWWVWIGAQHDRKPERDQSGASLPLPDTSGETDWTDHTDPSHSSIHHTHIREIVIEESEECGQSSQSRQRCQGEEAKRQTGSIPDADRVEDLF